MKRHVCMEQGWIRLGLLFSLIQVSFLLPNAAAEVPFPEASPGSDPYRYEDYCFLKMEGGVPVLPANYTGGHVWKYSSLPSEYEEPGDNPKATGVSVDRAWEITTGRPDVVIAVIDSGVRWDDVKLRDKFFLNRSELPLPQGSTRYDRNGDGVFNMEDFQEDGRVLDFNGNGMMDPEDLIKAFSDSRDDDGNGYVDDICGWDMVDDDNDPYDDVAYGHGTGQSEDSCQEAYSQGGAGFPGTCPNCMILPVRVGQSYMAEDTNFARSLVFSVDSGADVVQEALGGLNYTAVSTAAIEYAYAKEVPIIASAADEESMHQNIPAVHEHMIVLNAVTKYAEGMEPPSYLYLSGCTNYGGNIAASVSSTSCSSEAVGRGAGIAGLVLSAAKNEMARGNLFAPLTANELKQVLTQSADDIDFTGHYDVRHETFASRRFPSGPGWDQYFGYGRLNAFEAVRMVQDGRIPPEADLVSPRWFDTFDPSVHPTVEISGYVAANRAPSYTYVVEWGRGIQPAPSEWVVICDSSRLDAPREGLLCQWDITPFLAEVSHAPTWINEFTFSLRIVVTDENGNRAESRKTIYLHHDDDLKSNESLEFSSSGEASVVTVDLDGDNVEDLVFPGSDGTIHALRGDLTSVDGWPVQTNLMAYRYEGSDAYVSGMLDPAIHEPIGAGGIAVGDLDADGAPEVVAASLSGHVYVWNRNGSLREGFPVSLHAPYSLNPKFTPYEQFNARDKFNRRLYGVMSAPVFEDLDRDGELEIICGALDNHVYVWRNDGQPMPGWPVLVLDPAMVRVVEESTHRVAPDVPATRYEMGRIVSTPAVGDINGDGYPEILIGTNEEYDEQMNIGLFSNILGLVGALDLMGANTRLHALHHDGSRHEGGAFVQGWPVPIALLVEEMVPYVAYGFPGSPILADLEQDGMPEIAAFSASGPVYLLRGDGSSVFGRDLWGNHNVMDVGGIFNRNYDMPSTPGLGFPIFADLEGRGSPSLIAPSVGWKALYDTRLAAQQVGGENHITAWDPETGDILDGFPALMDDLQFYTGPSVVDVDGDGRPEVIEGSGGFLLRAYNAKGETPPGWPKLTGRWIVSPPAVGDVDGDGLLELAVRTRMGDLYIWETLAPECDSLSRQWRTSHHDAWNTGVYGRDVNPPGRPLDFQGVRDGSLLHLTWSAVAEDGNCGLPASGYVIKGGDADLESSWKSAEEIATVPGSLAVGSSVEISVQDLGFTHVGIQATDDSGNRSRIVALSTQTFPDLQSTENQGGCGCSTSKDPRLIETPVIPTLILVLFYCALLRILARWNGIPLWPRAIRSNQPEEAHVRHDP